jgi:hypothetical protein
MVLMVIYLGALVVCSTPTVESEHETDGPGCYRHYCDIERTIVRADEDIILPDKPHIFVYEDKLARNSQLRELGTRTNLIEHYGDDLIRLTSSNSYSQGMERIALGTYLESFTAENAEDTEDNLMACQADSNLMRNLSFANDTMYLFGGNFDGVVKEMEEIYEMPRCNFVLRLA